MVTILIKVMENEGVVGMMEEIKCDDPTSLEKMLAKLLLEKINDNAPGWIKEETGAKHIGRREVNFPDLESASDGVTPNEEMSSIFEKKFNGSPEEKKSAQEFFDSKADEFVKMLPEEARETVRQRIRMIAKTFDIAAEFGEVVKIL